MLNLKFYDFGNMYSDFFHLVDIVSIYNFRYDVLRYQHNNLVTFNLIRTCCWFLDSYFVQEKV